jgi:hypothetical protein
MHQYVKAPFERIANDIAGPFPERKRSNRYLLIAKDFTKWPEVYAISKQKASTVADAPVSNFIGRFGVSREVKSDQGWNF